MPKENGKYKWLVPVLAAVIGLSVFLVGLNRAAITEMPEKYVRLERYKADIVGIKSDIAEVKLMLIRIDDKMDVQRQRVGR